MVGGGWGCPQAYAEVVARLSLDGLLVTSLSYKGIGPQHTGVCVCVWGLCASVPVGSRLCDVLISPMCREVLLI